MSSIVKAAEQAFSIEDGGKLRADALQLRQHSRRCRRGFARRLEQSVTLRVDRLQLLQDDFEPIEFAADLRLQVHRQRTAIPCLQVFQMRPAVTL